MNAPEMNVYSNVYNQRAWMIPYYILPSDLKESKRFNKWLNDLRFVNNLNRFTNMRISSFEWIGLPDTVDPVILEMCLLVWGNIGMYRDEDGNFLCLPLFPYGKDGVSVNGRPYNGYLYRFNGTTINCKLYQQGIDEPLIRETATRKLVDATYDTVWGQENYISYSFFNQIVTRIHDLTLRQRILNQNIRGSAQPIIITCAENEKESIKKELEEIDEGQFRILAVRGAFDQNKYEVLDTGFKPEVIQILADEIQRCEDEIRTLLGINSNGAMANKKERLLVDEVNSNNSLIDAEVEQALVFRKRFCEQCKEAFGLDIDVKFRYATPEIEDYSPDTEQDVDLEQEIKTRNERRVGKDRVW